MISLTVLKKLLLSFESLGDNCEFGLVQRQFGIEPLGLLRFAFTPMRALLLGLERGFEGMDDPDKLVVSVAKNKELILTVNDYEIFYHSQRLEGEIDTETLRHQESVKLKFIKRRFLDRLSDNKTIFVRKGQESKSLDQARTLHRAMQHNGKAALLWLTEADKAHKPGSVAHIEPGLLWGRVDRFAPYTDAQDISLTSWVNLCQGARHLWRVNPEAGGVWHPPRRNTIGGESGQAANLLMLPHAAALMGPHPRMMLLQERVETEILLGPFPCRSIDTHTVCRHHLPTAEASVTGLRANGLEPEKAYTFSLWIRLADSADIHEAKLHFAGSPALRTRHVRRDTSDKWQRLEVTAFAPAEGLAFPRLTMRGNSGAVFYTANWRLEEGPVVDAQEYPGAILSDA